MSLKGNRTKNYLGETPVGLNPEDSFTGSTGNPVTPTIASSVAFPSVGSSLRLNDSLSGANGEGTSPLPILEDNKEEEEEANDTKEISATTYSQISNSSYVAQSANNKSVDAIELPEMVASLINKENAKKNIADMFEVLSVLANGKFTTVYQVKHVLTNEKYALKRLQVKIPDFLKRKKKKKKLTYVLAIVDYTFVPKICIIHIHIYIKT
ncbi:hypothetical protein RFI_01624 [Reticulomyxa filosa]|uniref:Protein kinase domain-containing protein n=1 Tax=Reticulomyxa filosa TaxID=46433 RepID=X6PBA3_RETFI|nr:hypothetical protein RFI_01624 [Reticulomyxa filosa]|eukprot:ETO35441.1 hypothetical protein RFI_01624 [Reticulomyxa filosa]